MRIVSVTDRANCPVPLEEQVERICLGGADMVVLREKDLSEKEYLALAERIRRICSVHGTEFCVNTFTGVASELGVGTVWVPFGLFREEGRRGMDRVGVSVHSPEEAAEAEGLGADFLVFGNVFETTCKPGKKAAGIDSLRRICGSVDIPVYAIGGMGPSNSRQAEDAGAEGVCMMSALMGSDDPASVISETRRSLRASSGRR